MDTSNSLNRSLHQLRFSRNIKERSWYQPTTRLIESLLVALRPRLKYLASPSHVTVEDHASLSTAPESERMKILVLGEHRIDPAEPTRTLLLGEDGEFIVGTACVNSKYKRLCQRPAHYFDARFGESWKLFPAITVIEVLQRYYEREIQTRANRLKALRSDEARISKVLKGARNAKKPDTLYALSRTAEIDFWR